MRSYVSDACDSATGSAVPVLTSTVKSPSRLASPPLVIEEVRFLGLNDDHIEQVPPVLPHDVPHPFISGTRQPGELTSKG